MHLTWGYDLVSQVQPGDRVLHWQTRAPPGLVGWSEVELISLIGELSTQSGEFRCRWAAHDVRIHRTGRKRLVHPVPPENRILALTWAFSLSRQPVRTR